MNTTEIRTGEIRLGTVKYVRLRKRWRWNPRKGITNLVLLIFLLLFVFMAFYYSAVKSQGKPRSSYNGGKGHLMGATVII